MRHFVVFLFALAVAAPGLAADWTSNPDGGEVVTSVSRGTPQAFVVIRAQSVVEWINVEPGIKVLVRVRRAIDNPQGAPAVSVEAYDCPKIATAYNDEKCSQVQSESVSSLTGVHPSEYLWNISVGGKMAVRTSLHPGGTPGQGTLVEVRYEGGEGRQ